MSARLRRIASDYEQIKSYFEGHKYVLVEPILGDPPEKYRVTYFVNGIYLQGDGRIETLGKHVVEITLHSEYPRYKPICKIYTPIWHPNFKDGQICIGDIWGAGESLSDIIVNIGDMIQYKSWNSFSPLSAEAAQWAIENRNLFPVGNANLYKDETRQAVEDMEIDFFEEEQAAKSEAALVGKSRSEEAAAPVATASIAGVVIGAAIGATAAFGSNTETVAEPEIEPLQKQPQQTVAVADEPTVQTAAEPVLMTAPAQPKGNDFEITADDLIGVVYVPSAQRMQSLSQVQTVVSKRINFKTVFTKGILYGLIGALAGWILSELLSKPTDTEAVLSWMGFGGIADLYNMSELQAMEILKSATRISSAIFTGSVAALLGGAMGLGEGIYYGSKQKAIRYLFAGMGIALLTGFFSGYIAQAMYSAMLNDSLSLFLLALVRGIGWAVMGLGVGLAVGLIKPDKRRLLFCAVGGALGGFGGGFLFDFISTATITSETDTGIVPRAIGIVIVGLLIGLGIGLLEQYAKSAWLKVVRGEFEGKEYLVFSGTTSIGNTGKNNIVLFKDKLVAPYHCEIVQEGSRYVLCDKGAPLGTYVNGVRISRHNLKNGDAIAVGNSVLVFNMK